MIGSQEPENIYAIFRLPLYIFALGLSKMLKECSWNMMKYN